MTQFSKRDDIPIVPSAMVPQFDQCCIVVSEILVPCLFKIVDISAKDPVLSLFAVAIILVSSISEVLL